MLNPNEPLRAAYVEAIQTATGLQVWAKKVPKDVVIPDQYIIINSQSKTLTEEYKNLSAPPLVANKFEWLCTITLDLYNINLAGFGDPAINDAIEALVISAVQDGIEVDGFEVKSYSFIDSIDLDIETDTQSIERRVVTYQHWLCQRQEG